MILQKSNTEDARFLKLEKLLDEELEHIYPNEMDPYTPFNKFKTPIKAILLAFHL